MGQDQTNQEPSNHEVALRMYASAAEKEAVEQLMRDAKFENMSDYLRHCVEVEAEARGAKFKLSPRKWGGYRAPRAKTKNMV